jgi:hypothetical protein
VAIRFRNQVDVGDGKAVPPNAIAAGVTAVLSEIGGGIGHPSGMPLT